MLGYYLPAEQGAGDRFVSLPPARVHDAALAAEGLVPAGGDRIISLAQSVDGAAAVPPGASAAAYNVTVAGVSGPGHLRIMPGDAGVPDLRAELGGSGRAHRQRLRGVARRSGPDEGA